MVASRIQVDFNQLFQLFNSLQTTLTDNWKSNTIGTKQMRSEKNAKCKTLNPDLRLIVRHQT